MTISSPDYAKKNLYSHWVKNEVRYGDTDRQGHVNNAVFATFLESGRVAILYNSQKPLVPPGCSFVIARLILDYRAEIHWPNEVEVGTTLVRIGNSSITFGQGVFVKEQCAATAETVIVLVNDVTRKSQSLPNQTRQELEKLLIQ